MYEDLKEIIDNTSVLQQGGVGDVDEQWIIEAEAKLGLPFPPSYRWWLTNYGSGFLDGQPIYTLAPPEFRDTADNNIMTANETNRNNGLTEDGRLYFFEPDGDERFFFDMLTHDNDGDNPVMVEDLAEQEIREYGGNFAYFLRNEIEMRN